MQMLLRDLWLSKYHCLWRIVIAWALSYGLFASLTHVAKAQDFIYTTNIDSTLTITGYIGAGGAIDIPSNIAGVTVANIGSNAFLECTNILSVTIPFGVTNIGENAFRSCYNMVRVDIPDSIQNIGDRAFRYCSNLSWAVIGNSVTNIGIGAFASSIIPELTIPSNVVNLSSGAFQYCSNLTSVSISYGLQNIGHYVFDYCVSLSRINIPDSVTNIGFYAFRSCTNMTSVTIGNSIMLINHDAFSYCPNLTGVYFRSNAPTNRWDTFLSSDNVVVYYLHGTTGWPPVPSLWADRPTAYWLPKIHVDYPTQEQSGHLGLSIDWAEGKTVVLEASTNLLVTNWMPVTTNTLTNSPTIFIAPHWDRYGGCFYRLRSQ
jgi:hypothetical protein